MAYPECKVYSDGSHYIAIPHTEKPYKPRPKKQEEIITVKPPNDSKPSAELSEVQANSAPQESDALSPLEQIAVTGELLQELSPANIMQPNERRMTKKELFNERYQEYLHLKKGERRERLIAALRPYFKTDMAVKNYVDSNIERKRRNLICRRIRLTRKVNLQDFTHFVTFTFNGELHTEETFRKGLKKTLANFSSRKGWKYVGVWERSPKKQRLHFHGLFYIPTDDKKTLGRSVDYIMKYLEKTGEKIVYSKGLPQYFISDITDDDVVCPIGLEDKKLLLFDNFDCWDEGEYIVFCPKIWYNPYIKVLGRLYGE